MNIIYDIETYPNCFLICAEDADSDKTRTFEISDWKNDSIAIRDWLIDIKRNGGRMVGFNNVGFDWPVVDMLLRMGQAHPRALYDKAIAIINSDNRWQHNVKPTEVMVKQIDLYRIHHFDNVARSTSLKMLEFNMRMENIHDLPFPVGTVLSRQQADMLIDYCRHDVIATKRFYFETLDAIRFREQLTEKHQQDMMNLSDVAIGKRIFQMELEKAGVQLYSYGPNGREPRQTKRPRIALADCIPTDVGFRHPEFNRILEWFRGQVVTETKGVFKDLTATIEGLEYVFGTGGIHASQEQVSVVGDDEWMILDVDVTSLYPSIAITRGYCPDHLGKTFVDIYARLKDERIKYPKGSPENAALKLALNGTYGASNDKFSVFYDPLFTMKITIGGQLMLAMLIDRLLIVNNLRILQANTDGVTMIYPRNLYFMVDIICKQWETDTMLQLESVEYDRVFLADVNSYIAIGKTGKVKRKGRYEYDVDWHQNHGSLVIPKVAEKVLVDDCSIKETVENWPDRMDFMMRVKVPKGSSLVMQQNTDDIPLENTQRYYVAKGGGQMVKIMPPLAGKTEYRRINIESGWGVCPCNDITEATMPINFDYYIQEVEKLCLGVM
jgi:hypothetical protein